MTHTADKGLLTDDEQTVVRLAGELWGAICTAIPDGPTRDADLHELVLHIHAVQHTFMANAAARAYPQTYRLLGSTVSKCLTCESWGRSHCGEHSGRVTAPGKGAL